MLLVVTITILLNTFQVWIYLKAKSSLIPSYFLVEQHYRFDFSSPPWRVRGHVLSIARAMVLYGIVAPTPFILTHEIGALVPKFRTSETVISGFHVAGYHGLADIIAKLWILISVAAVLYFLKNLFRNPHAMLFSTGLLLCLGFNFALHLAYGDDPLLHSADWVYALILFVSFAFRNWADKKWFQRLLIIFLGLMMFTNLGLIRQILQAVLPYCD